MTQYSLEHCPVAARAQITRLLSAMSAVLGDYLAGVYLHGFLRRGGRASSTTWPAPGGHGGRSRSAVIPTLLRTSP